MTNLYGYKRLKERNFESEFIFSTSRSGGPGGQNVNKVSSKVELRFCILTTTSFSDKEKEIIFKKLKNKITKEGDLVLVSQTERTQVLNKRNVTEKFYEMIAKALTVQAMRRSTRPTFLSKIKRLEDKRSRGFVKKMRMDSDKSMEDQ